MHTLRSELVFFCHLTWDFLFQTHQDEDEPASILLIDNNNNDNNINILYSPKSYQL
jgi:hypothetical protein